MTHTNNGNTTSQTESLHTASGPQTPPMPDPAPEAGQHHVYQQPPAGHQSYASHPMPGAPLAMLTGGMKFGWALAAFLMGPVAILLAWLVNLTAYPHARNDAIKFAVIGFVAQFVLGFLLMSFFGMTACAALGSLDPRSMMYY